MFLILAASAQESVDPGPVVSDDPEPVTVPVAVPEDEKPFPLKVGVGLFFNAGGAFQAQPQDRGHPDFTGELPYSGMAGFSPGAGARLDVRLYDILGIELQVIRAWDQAESKYTINGTDVGFQVKQPAWHVPINLQIGVPSKILRPYLFGGIEMVIPTRTEFPSPAGIPWSMSGGTKTFHMWDFGFGFETRLPIEGVDLRVPLQFRGSASAPWSTVATDRADYTILPGGILTSAHYDTRWQYYASINLGLSWFFPE